MIKSLPKQTFCLFWGVTTSPKAAGISRNDASLAFMAGEALSHVQGESLKGSATVFRRFVNSPVTSMLLVTVHRNEGEFMTIKRYFLLAIFIVGIVYVSAIASTPYLLERKEIAKAQAHAEKLAKSYEQAFVLNNEKWLLVQYYKEDLATIGKYYPEKRRDLEAKLESFYAREDIKIELEKLEAQRKITQANQYARENDWLVAIAKLRELEPSPYAPADLQKRIDEYKRDAEQYYVKQTEKTDTNDNLIKAYTSLTLIAPHNKEYKAMLEGFKRIKEKELANEQSLAKDLEDAVRKYGPIPQRSGSANRYIEVELYLEKVANDPESLKMGECSVAVIFENIGWAAQCEFRARNGFGGMVRDTKWFIMSGGTVISAAELSQIKLIKRDGKIPRMTLRK